MFLEQAAPCFIVKKPTLLKKKKKRWNSRMNCLLIFVSEKAKDAAEADCGEAVWKSFCWQ